MDFLQWSCISVIYIYKYSWSISEAQVRITRHNTVKGYKRPVPGCSRIQSVCGMLCVMQAHVHAHTTADPQSFMNSLSSCIQATWKSMEDVNTGSGQSARTKMTVSSRSVLSHRLLRGFDPTPHAVHPRIHWRFFSSFGWSLQWSLPGWLNQLGLTGDRCRKCTFCWQKRWSGKLHKLY